ncbi:MAG: decaprenyl-phosphate phosphoribosyltransferase [Prevotella sp.]|nr:decaprenyl-phosphate phosphoribosyltransferase [Prevotella sp.]
MYNLLRLTRPNQWIKNLFVFFPIFFGEKMFVIQLMFNTLVAFFAFSFAASSIYCLNDIIDVDDDRRHSVKCNRPLASGKVSIPSAYAIMLLLLALSIATLFLIDSQPLRLSTIMVIVIYWFMQIGYCTYLKRYAIIDVCTISIGFILRIQAGGAATGIDVSQWLIMMTFLLTLFLGIAKRRDDVLRLERTGVQARNNTRRYNLTFVNEALTITGSVMLVCYIMYTVDDDVVAQFNSPYIYLTSIFVMMGLLRYMQLAIVDEDTGDPTKVLLKDRIIQSLVLGWLLSFLVLIYS